MTFCSCFSSLYVSYMCILWAPPTQLIGEVSQKFGVISKTPKRFPFLSKKTYKYCSDRFVVDYHSSVPMSALATDGLKNQRLLWANSWIQKWIQLFRERLSNWKALKRTRQYRKALWAVVVRCCIVKFTSFFSAMEGGAMNTCLLVLKGTKRILNF